MKARKKPVEQKSFLLPTLAEQLDARRPIYQLAGKIPWGDFEEEFGAFYSEEGRPAKPVRLMVGLLILKQLHDLGDETVVEAWRENPYWQYFCGETEMSKKRDWQGASNSPVSIGLSDGAPLPPSSF